MREYRLPAQLQVYDDALMPRRAHVGAVGGGAGRAAPPWIGVAARRIDLIDEDVDRVVGGRTGQGDGARLGRVGVRGVCAVRRRGADGGRIQVRDLHAQRVEQVGALDQGGQ